ncbi:septum site-determining protein MinC [Brevibacillus sp. LEMMJ03]|jgi:septum site-determining protein MinC|uniref:Probable septum site-determining protein MinC n=1 Tax=Brevibacillus thermoruber TaxID=33942 RepID=A0A9X3TR75_9BACL|nr:MULTISPECIES: septum site-determining protein MinC [Brevibacillus]MDA5109002.1 septum site-determining protein MinC [Brevibacillus thermoruber]TRY26397.1 septum site-determining protein MinC [Brevibacillus sp. LEMMJ03]UYZ12412.1 septum site-determining protein MinC [Brevibacillus sp. WF146]
MVSVEVKQVTTVKNKVTIKGTKDGLVFFMDDACSFDELLADLREKIEHSHQQILSGPLIRVSIKLGKRYCSPEQQEQLTQIIRQKGNLVIHTIEADVITKEEAFAERLKSTFSVQVHTVRAGQVLEFDGDLLLLGDVNPGGIVRTTGSIYVLGHLRGYAHAGINGDTQVIIAAAVMNPTQLRIAEVISRPGEEWAKNGGTEFAYLEDGTMLVAKMNYLPRIRPELGAKKV